MTKRDVINKADEFYISHHRDQDSKAISKDINLKVNLVRQVLNKLEPMVAEPKSAPKMKVKIPKGANIKSQTGNNMGAMLTDELREVEETKRTKAPEPHIFRFEVAEE
jgi:hypothetical protein